MKAFYSLNIVFIFIFSVINSVAFAQVVFIPEEIDSVGSLGDLKVGYFNNDERKDIVGTNFGQDKFYAITPTSGFDYYALDFDATDPIGLEVVDYDGDGDSDLIVVGRENIYFANNITTGQITKFQKSVGDIGLTNSAFAVGNFNNSAGIDVIIGSTGTQELLMFQNLTGIFYNTIVFDDTNVRRPGDIHAVDLVGNGFPEVVYADFFNDYISVYEYDQVFQTTEEIVVDNNINTAIAVNSGDFNNDGHIDIVGSAFTPAKVYVYLSDGVGGYEKIEIASSIPEITAIEVGDLDNDSDLDIVGYNQKDDQLEILLNNNMVFERSSLDDSKEFQVAFALDDFDSDGKLDIVACADKVVHVYYNMTPTSTTTEIEKSLFSFYPNPVENQLKIEGDSDISLNLFTLQGELVKEMAVGQNDIFHIPNGMYLLNGYNQQTGLASVKKVIINR